MHRYVACCVLFMLIVSCGRNIEPTPAMLEASIQWLALLDAGEVEQAYQETASIFRPAVTQEAWHNVMADVRTPLGAFKGRALRTVIAKENPTGSPEGNYILMTFDSSFTHGQEVIESLTLFQESNGIWRTAGYFAK